MLLKSLISSDSERGFILIDSRSGLPHFNVTLYSTVMLRNRSLSAQSIKANLNAIRFMYQYFDSVSIDIDKRFEQGQLLSISEIEGFISACGLKLDEVTHDNGKNVIRISTRTESHRLISIPSVKKVKSQTKYIRITYSTKYIKWLAFYLNPSLAKDINQMYGYLNSRRPVKSSKRISNHRIDEKGLDDDQLDKIYEVLDYSSPLNPFQTQESKVRNRLLIVLFHRLGIRRSEALTIRISDFKYRTSSTDIESTLLITRQADSEEDMRVNQPTVKTLPREFPLSESLADQIYHYYKEYRAKTPNAKKHPFLFVTHKAGKNQGQPMSISSVNKVLDRLQNACGFHLHPHMFRHRWNYDFSVQMDKLEPPLSPEQQEISRSYYMGWKQGSGTAQVYNERFVREKAWNIQLQMQGVNLDD